MATPKVMIISGNGFNCERETHYAFSMCGAEAEYVHMNDLTAGKITLEKYQILAFIGGFSYGDHLGGGKVTAIKFKYHLSDQLKKFIDKDTLIIGICNGFQVITQLGILPGFNGDYTSHTISVAANISNRYEDRWVNLKANANSPCIFTKNIDKIFLPIRHGEGKVTARDKKIIDTLFKNGQVALQYIDPETGLPTEKYPHNPNGTDQAIAGICDETGRILGLMPHPEAFLSPYNHPHWTRLVIDDKLPGEGAGVQIFRNAVEYFN